MRIFFCLICFMFFFATAPAAQTCKTASIPASTPDSQLIDNGDGTITDTKTNLMWKKCVEGLSGSDCEIGMAIGLNWQEALEQAGAVNNGGGFAGYNDWRLPNIKELASIVEEQCYGPAINLTRFSINTLGNYFYWSGSPDAVNTTNAWYVDFVDGHTFNFNRTASLYVRLVRSR